MSITTKIAVTIALSIAASGCGGGGLVPSASTSQKSSPAAKPSSAPAETPTPPPAESPSPTPTETPNPPPDTSGGDVAPPGTVVALGKPVTIPIASGTSRRGTAVATVRIEKGAAADLTPLRLGERAKGLVPYYVRITFRKVGGTTLSHGEYSTYFNGRLPDDTKATSLFAVGFDKCRSESAPKEFDSGQPYETCRPFLAPEASKVSSVAYRGQFD